METHHVLQTIKVGHFLADFVIKKGDTEVNPYTMACPLYWFFFIFQNMKDRFLTHQKDPLQGRPQGLTVIPQEFRRHGNAQMQKEESSIGLAVLALRILVGSCK